MKNESVKVENEITLNEKKYTYIVEFKKIKNLYLRVKDGKIYVSAPKKVTFEKIEKLILDKEKWILDIINKPIVKKEKIKKYSDEEFLNLINEYVKEYSNKLKLYPNKVTIKSLKYAWGSCTKNKNISFNRELIYYRIEGLEYVIVHELAHLKYMNHQKKFWDLVSIYIPNYKELRKELKEN